MVTRARLAVMLLGALSGTHCHGIAGIMELPGPMAEEGTRDAADAGPVASPARPDASPPSDAPASDGPASCVSLPKTCGEAGTADCCESLPVPGGEFVRRFDRRDFTYDGHRARLSPYRLDRFEVTVGRFRAFVDAYARGFRPAPGSGKNVANRDDSGFRPEWSNDLPASADELAESRQCQGRKAPGRSDGQGGQGGTPPEPPLRTYTKSPGDAELRPVNCVSWYVAFAFCVWDGGRLPTDAELNFAAAGGDEQRYYPWKDGLDESRASYFVDDQKKCFGDRNPGCSLADLTFVGAHPAGAGRFGHDDLAGNVAEWVRDGDAAPPLLCEDCHDAPNDRGERRVRGGAFNSQGPGPLRVAATETAPPSESSERIGFRCARAP